MQGGGIISCGGNFGMVLFRHPCESQSLHCPTHTLHCPNPQISPGENFAPFLKDENFPRKYPRPKSPPPLYKHAQPVRHMQVHGCLNVVWSGLCGNQVVFGPWNGEHGLLLRFFPVHLHRIFLVHRSAYVDPGKDQGRGSGPGHPKRSCWQSSPTGASHSALAVFLGIRSTGGWAEA